MHKSVINFLLEECTFSLGQEICMAQIVGRINYAVNKLGLSVMIHKTCMRRT